jgi:hypothetical protein
MSSIISNQHLSFVWMDYLGGICALFFCLVWEEQSALFLTYFHSHSPIPISAFILLSYISVYILNLVPFVYSIFFYFTFVGCVGGAYIFRTHLSGILVSFFPA